MNAMWCGCGEWFTVDRPRPITRGTGDDDEQQPDPQRQ